MPGKKLYRFGICLEELFNKSNNSVNAIITQRYYNGFFIFKVYYDKSEKQAYVYFYFILYNYSY